MIESFFFKLGDRPYVNNAVVIADVLNKAKALFKEAPSDFSIKFKSPLTSQAKMFLGTSPEDMDGYPVKPNVIGSFNINAVKFWFAYTAMNKPLIEEKDVVNEVGNYKVQVFSICNRISLVCADAIDAAFDASYERTPKDKIIFTEWALPKTYHLYDNTFPVEILAKNRIINIRCDNVKEISPRKFQLDVWASTGPVWNRLQDDIFLGTRTSVVKEFKL